MFDSNIRIYLCINIGISFVFHDSALCLRGFMEVGATIYMSFSGGVLVLCMCELY